MAKKSELKEPIVAYASLDDKSVYTLISAIKAGIQFSFFLLGYRIALFQEGIGDNATLFRLAFQLEQARPEVCDL